MRWQNVLLPMMTLGMAFPPTSPLSRFLLSQAFILIIINATDQDFNLVSNNSVIV